MSELPPDSSFTPPPVELSYETPRQYGNAPLLVRLAGIFNLVSAGLDLLYVVSRIVMLIFFLTMLKGAMMVPPPGPGAAPATPMPTWLPLLLQGIPALLSLIACGLKVWAGIAFFRLRRRTWAVGLTGGIAGVIEFWSCPCCIVNMGAGVYTIVILCMPHVREFIQARENAAQTS